MHFDYLIIGSGIAGISAVETLRKFNKEAIIGLISNEPHDPYSKVLLPFYLKGKINYDQLFIRGKNFWQKNNIHFIHGKVSELDRHSKSVKYIDLSVESHLNPLSMAIGGGERESVSYDKLLIASGANAKKLNFSGNDLPGIFYFRNLDETIKMKKYLDNFHSDTTVYQHTPVYKDTPVYRSEGPKPIIYGASFIALEFAGIFAHFGIGAKIIFRGPYFWSRLLDEAGGKLIESFLEQAGMEVYRNEQIIDDRLLSVNGDLNENLTKNRSPKNQLEKIITTRGEYKCNFLGLGVGLEPNLEFARVAGLKVNQGIIADEFLQTSDSNIFAAGDVAEFYDLIIGRHHVLGNWLNSDMQGRCAAANMLGAKKPFELVSSYNFNFDGKKGLGAFNICVIGDTNFFAPLEAQTIKRDQQYLRTFSKDNRMVGAIIINAPKLRKKIITAIKICANFKISSSIFD